MHRRGVGAGGAVRRFDWHFFFLGAAFMLLETRSLVTFALLFGTTWMVNSLVFFAILSSVLAAVLINARLKITRVGLLYAALFALLALNFAIPVRRCWHRVARRCATARQLLAFAPIFVANVVFSRSFRDTERPTAPSRRIYLRDRRRRRRSSISRSRPATRRC